MAFGEAVTFAVGRFVGRAVVIEPVSVVFVMVVFVTVTLVVVVLAMVPLLIDVTLKRFISKVPAGCHSTYLAVGLVR